MVRDVPSQVPTTLLSVLQSLQACVISVGSVHEEPPFIAAEVKYVVVRQVPLQLPISEAVVEQCAHAEIVSD